MLEPTIYYLSNLSGKDLDYFLSIGFYRMGQGIYSTHNVFMQDQFFEVSWIRYFIPSVVFSKSMYKILRNNNRFSTQIKPLIITAEIENLYSIYKSALDFDPAISVTHWLMEEQSHNIFDTYMIEVRDKDILIAVGIFDKGKTGIAGIMNFYHPEYKKFSPGKYLMLAKLQYASTMGMLWYYPGYIVKGYLKFDYKLFMGVASATIYLPEKNVWIPYTR